VAARVKVIDLAKELGVTSKDLIGALEAMGQKGMRAMSPLQAPAANELRVKLGRGRDLPEEAKPKRAPKAKPAAGADTESAVAKKKAAGIVLRTPFAGATQVFHHLEPGKPYGAMASSPCPARLFTLIAASRRRGALHQRDQSGDAKFRARAGGQARPAHRLTCADVRRLLRRDGLLRPGT